MIKEKKRKTRSKPRLDLLLRILQRLLTPRLATPHPIDLRPREPLRLHGGVIPSPGPPAHLFIDIFANGVRIGPAIRAPVDGHDGGAAETEIVLQGDFGVGDEAVRGPAAKLPDEFGTLRYSDRAERVAFEDEAAGRVHDAAASVGDIAAAHHGVCLARGTEA